MINRREGFSLVEVLIGLVLLGVALLAIASSFTSSTKLMVQTVEKEKATFLATRTLDFIEGHEISEDQGDWGISFSDLSSDVVMPAPYNVNWTITNDNGAKVIDLTITWEGATPNSNVNMTRYLSSFGHETVDD